MAGTAGYGDTSWDVVNKSGLVNIGTHSLWLNARGPSRAAGDPAVIIIQGLGISVTGWVVVERLLTPFIRVFSYDRTGYGSSDSSSELPTAAIIVQELDQLLTSAVIPPPYIVVAHSWGGVLSREFLELRSKDVAGMVFVEANQEHTLEVLDWRILSNSPVLDGVDRNNVTGISQSHALTEEEWKIYQATEASEKHQKQLALEYEQYPKSFPVLATKHQLQRHPPVLGARPVCVIKGDNGKDFEKLYAAGVVLGNGNATERAAYLDMLRTWNTKDRELQSGNFGLSSAHHYFEVPDSGHNVQLKYPERIVDGVKWVVDRLQKGGD